jgi:hypothetical protein
MANHMKTTVQIPDPFFEEMHSLAHQEKTTMKALIQEGLRRIISERKQAKRFGLRKATFNGHGLHPDLKEASWDQIREKSYEGRGGCRPL